MPGLVLGLEQRLPIAHWAQMMQLTTSYYQPLLFSGVSLSYHCISNFTVTNCKFWNTVRYFLQKFSEEENTVIKLIGPHTTLCSLLKKSHGGAHVIMPHVFLHCNIRPCCPYKSIQRRSEHNS